MANQHDAGKPCLTEDDLYYIMRPDLRPDNLFQTATLTPEEEAELVAVLEDIKVE